MKAICTFGALLVLMGTMNGWEHLAKATGYECLNTLTKDQMSCIIGATWLIVAWVVPTNLKR